MRGNLMAPVGSAQRREQGAVATIVAIVLFTGVAFGALALSLDVGQMMMEKRQLQNGADSVAMYLARDCAENGQCNVNTSNAATTALDDSNSTNASNTLQLRCYYNVSTFTNDLGCPSGPSTSGTFDDCGPLPSGVPTNLPFAQVVTRSKAASSGGLRNWFAQVIGGDANTNVGACGRAAWGSAAPASVLPITMSMCAWTTAMNTTLGSTTPPTYPPAPVGAAPGYGGAGQPAFPTTEATIFQKAQVTPGCPASAGGGSAAGNFNQLLDAGGRTTTAPVASADGSIWIAGDTGNPTPCKKNVSPNLSNRRGTVVYIPIFNCTSGTTPTAYVTPTCNTVGA